MASHFLVNAKERFHYRSERAKEPQFFDDLIGRLRRNELRELELCWSNSRFITGKRSAAALERVLKTNISLRSVSIGWRYSHKESLIRVLTAITRHCRLEHIKLVLDDCIPETVMTLLLRNQKNLVSINLQAVQVHSEHSFRDHSVVSRCILQQYQHHPFLKKISLTECNLTDDEVTCLADFLHIRGGIAELSLRSNRKLTGKGLRMICQAPVMDLLDLSLCDLVNQDAEGIAMGIASRPWPVRKLVLAGNYRLGTAGLLALIRQNCCQKVASLDLSFCECKDYRTALVLDALSALKPTTTLQRITLHGSYVGSDMVASSLQKLLKSQSSLRSIRLNDPQESKPMKAPQLRIVLEGLQNNFDVEELLIDTISTTDERMVWKEIDFFLRLNVAGRRILRPHKKARDYTGFRAPKHDDWIDVLEKAGKEDLTVLFWIVRQGANHFDQKHMYMQA